MAKRRRKRRFRSTEEIREIIAAFDASGLSQAAFAREHGISPNSLSRWLQRSPTCDVATEPALVPVRVVPGVRPEPAYEVRLTNDRVVCVPTGFDDDELRRVLAAAEGTC